MEISFTQTGPERKYLLIELPESFLDKKAQEVPLSIKSSEDSSEAFICSDSETYALRHVRQSNTVLITRPVGTGLSNRCHLQSIANIPDYVECFLAEPSISLSGKLPVYQGSHLEANRTTSSLDVSLNQLIDLIPLSREQFEKMWIQNMGLELDGKAFLLSQDLAASIVSFALETCIALSIPITEIRFADISHRFEEFGEPLNVCKTALKKFSANKVSDDYKLNLPSIVAWYGVRTLNLYAKTPIPLPVFLQTWKSSLPQHEQLEPELSQLTRHYVMINNNQIQALSSDSLPTDIPGRFRALFSVKPTWQLEEIAPFLDPVYNGKVKLESFIMKYAKKKSIGSKTIVSAR